MDKHNLYYLNVNKVLSNFSLFTKYDIGEEGCEVVVEKKNLDFAIEEIAEDFKSLLYSSFYPYEEEEDS